MATITAGSGGTIQSPTLEGQFIQTFEYFQGLEAAGGNTTSYFSGAYDTDTLLFDGTFTLPLILAANSIAFTGKTDGFLTGTFTPGSGGTFTATAALDYFLQILSRFIAWQNNLAKNPTANKNLTAAINIANGTLSGGFSLPFTRNLTAQGITISPAEYLLT